MFKDNSKRKLDLIRRLKPITKNNHRLDITKLLVDSNIVLYNDNYIVDDIYTYVDEYNFEWVEYQLINLLTLEKRYMSIFEDDEIEIYFTHTKLKLRHLNLTRDEVLEKVESEDSIEYEDVYYYYDSDYGVTFKRSDGSTENCRVYEFESDECTSLSIEEWETGEFECHISNLIYRNSVTILSI